MLPHVKEKRKQIFHFKGLVGFLPTKHSFVVREMQNISDTVENNSANFHIVKHATNDPAILLLCIHTR